MRVLLRCCNYLCCSSDISVALSASVFFLQLWFNFLLKRWQCQRKLQVTIRRRLHIDQTFAAMKMSEAAPLSGNSLPGTSYGLEREAAEDSVELKDVVEAVGWRRYHMGLLFLTWLIQLAPASVVGAIPFVLRQVRKEFHVNETMVASVGSATMVGSIVGVMIFGWINDVWGRQRAAVTTCVGMGLMCLLHLLLPRPEPGDGQAQTEFAFLLALRFFVGIIFAGGSGTNTQLLFSEFIPSQYRGTALTLAHAGWSVGSIYILCVSRVFETNWRLILAAPSLVAGVALLALLRCPESLRWLFVMGRGEEGRKVLSNVMASPVLFAPPTTDVDLRALPRRIVLSQECQTLKTQSNAGMWESISELFGPDHRRVTLCTLLMMLSLNGGSYIAQIWFPEMITRLMDLPTMPYQLFMWCEILGWVGVAAEACVVDRWGRRPLLVSLLGVTAVLTYAFTVVPKTYEWLATLYIVHSIIVNTLWPAMLAYIAECFPTSIRGMATSFPLFWGRISAVVSPIMFGWLLDSNEHSPNPLRPSLILTTGIFAVGCVGALLIPRETANVSMEDV
eukprot:TRINITY_DN3717_c0_g3_i1.p1 TRINITY_DN3717_c0_g3~~TRINITY_DN3717_c0_g3_i1.p1  ORF type:complete len:562 (-),score=54.23 TRINITY_DN3717_c0_g3_i1:78-1763(-)